MMRRTLLSFIAVLFVCASSARAQSEKDFSTVRFYPAAGVGNYIGVDGAEVGGHLATSYGVFFDYSTDTLVVDKPCEGIDDVSDKCVNKETEFVAATGLAHVLASISLMDRAQISIDVPVGFTDSKPFATTIMREGSSTSPSIEIAPKQGFALADARLAGKARLFGEREDALRFSGVVFTTLPTAMITSNGDCTETEECSFTGERGVQIGGYFISEFAIPEFRVAANVGAAYRPERTFLTEEVGTEVLYGVAGQYNITPLFHFKAEATGAANVLGADTYPLEARGALSFGEDLVVMAGGGGGIIRDVGAPTYRIFLGVQYSPTVRDADQDGIEDGADACPTDVEDRDGFMDDDGCPEPDNDGDGIPDKKDSCDNEREDMDKFADDDGCPELDNDGDGVPDGYDSCEGAKEDLDGDRDDDGCPDLDTDRDGVRDDKDRCPNDPEDTDGLGDEDGCPEADFDGDSVPDVQDACPDATEWWNDILDEDGCPEDDEDNDTVADQVDRCPDDAETLNGSADADGCPDGAMVMVLRGQMLMPTATAEFDGDTLRGGPALVDAASDYLKRNHRRGSVRVVVVAPANDGRASARAEALAALIRKKSPGREITSAHVHGAPLRVELELLPPGWKELPRKIAPPPAAPAQQPSSAAPSVPAPASPAAPAAAPAAPAPATPAAKPATPAPAAPATPAPTAPQK